jgi:maltose alpha-D-glucosyltransferase / alpha-amylase
MGLRMEDRFPITDILAQTPTIPETCQWALFLRNHDELTLEMVTDEERDYMYRVYAQDPMMRLNLGIRRRLSPLLGNHRRRIELMKGLLFSLPGTPIIYYGDEIGMGDNIYLGDRDGVRTPMQWSADRNAGFSKANPQKLYLPIIIDPEYHYEANNVETLQNNSHSILWWMKRIIALRKRFKAFGRGSIEFLYPENRKVLAFLRQYQGEHILVVANLSRFVQYVELDLSPFIGRAPTEVFGRTPFPPIGESPYFLTLGPHSFYWFSLEPQERDGEVQETFALSSRYPLLKPVAKWESLFEEKARGELEEHLPRFLQRRRWFGGKARRIKTANILETLPLQDSSGPVILLLQVDYTEGDSEMYALPLTSLPGDQARTLMEEHPQVGFARLQLKGREEEGIIYDAMVDKAFCVSLLEAIAQRRRRKGLHSEWVATRMKPFFSLRGTGDAFLEPRVMKVEQSNTSVVYGDRFILKLFRRIHPGVNPDLEIGRFLTEKGFPNIPPVAGAIEIVRGKEPPSTLAILEGFVQNQGDAWEYTRDALMRFFDTILARRPAMEGASRVSPVEAMEGDLPPMMMEGAYGYIESARLLGRRTAELHLVLASDAADPAFAPEAFSKLYQRSLYQTAHSLTIQTLQHLTNRLSKLPETLRVEAEKILAAREEILSRFRSITEGKITATRIRVHGDYHLGQVLYTGNDFVIIDFEGEPARPISERRIKRSPLRDVAGMLRSFHYAAHAALFSLQQDGLVHPEDREYMTFWANEWYAHIGSCFLKDYLSTAKPGNFLPQTKRELIILLDFYLLEKGVYELGYELNNRPDWVTIPLQGIAQLLGV